MRSKIQFWHAAAEGNLALIQELLADEPGIDVNHLDLDDNGNSLVVASRGAHTEMVRFLLGLEEVNPNATHDHGKSSLHVACELRHTGILELLLADPRVDVNQPDEAGITPFYLACQKGHVEMVSLLLADGRIDVSPKEARDFDGEYRMKGSDYLKIVELTAKYQNDPETVRRQLRRELHLDESKAGELFALVIYLSDGYLRILEDRVEENGKRVNAKRFFKLAIRLPMELQMALCNRVTELGDFVVKKTYSEKGFRKFASGW